MAKIVQDISYGIVPLRKMHGIYEVLLGMSARYSYFQLPKGHKERGESDVEAAVRELLEETGHVPVCYLNSSHEWTENMNEAMPIQPITYRFNRTPHLVVEKSVVYFISQVEYSAEIRDIDEIARVDWLPVTPETASLLHFEENISHFLTNILPILPH